MLGFQLRGRGRVGRAIQAANIVVRPKAVAGPVVPAAPTLADVRGEGLPPEQRDPAKTGSAPVSVRPTLRRGAGIAGAAGPDVRDVKPPVAVPPLLAFDRAPPLPRIAGVAEGTAERMALGSARSIPDSFSGKIDSALLAN